MSYKIYYLCLKTKIMLIRSLLYQRKNSSSELKVKSGLMLIGSKPLEMVRGGVATPLEIASDTYIYIDILLLPALL